MDTPSGRVGLGRHRLPLLGRPHFCPVGDQPDLVLITFSFVAVYQEGARIVQHGTLLRLTGQVRLSVCVMALSAALLQAQQTPPPRDKADPPASGARFPGSGAQSPDRVRAGSAESSSLALRRELHSYDVGSTTHPRARSFCKSTAGDARIRASNGQTIQSIFVRGFADGIPNSGVPYDMAAAPLPCRGGLSVPLRDRDLAALRGCIVMQCLLSELDDPAVAGGAVWRSDAYDEPDGGDNSGRLRKVSIEIQFWREP